MWFSYGVVSYENVLTVSEMLRDECACLLLSRWVYLKRTILRRSSLINWVDDFEAVSRESLKYSPGSESSANIQYLP